MSQEVKHDHNKILERNKLLMKENMKLYRRIRVLRSQLKEPQVPLIRPLGLETLAELAMSLEREVEVGTHQK